MGSVSGPAPLVKELAALTPKAKDVGVPPKRKKPSLRAIINITDFERAASQLMDPKSFACKFKDL
jgi:hypothetical protein